MPPVSREEAEESFGCSLCRVKLCKTCCIMIINTFTVYACTGMTMYDCVLYDIEIYLRMYASILCVLSSFEFILQHI